MLLLNKEFLQQYPKANHSEWLETNGIGGWASSSIVNSHTRRYHGLLVAATVPPTERMVVVSKLDETIVSGNERFELGVNDYGNVIHPQGYQYLQSFSKDWIPEWIYQVKDIALKKSITMVRGENTASFDHDDNF